MIETGRPEALLPLALFMVLMLGVSFFVRWQASGSISSGTAISAASFWS